MRNSKQQFVKLIGFKTPIYLVFDVDLIISCFQLGSRSHRGPLKELIGAGLFSEGTSNASRVRRKAIQKKFDSATMSHIRRQIDDNHSAFDVSSLRSDFVLKTLKTLSIKTNVDIVLAPVTTVQKDKLVLAVVTILEFLDASLLQRLAKPSEQDRRNFDAAKDTIGSYVHQAIEMDTFERDSYLGILISCYRDGSIADPQDIIDEVLSLLGSGVETTGTMYFWVLYCFIKYNAVLPEPVSNEGQEEDFMDWFILEVLRHHPAAWAMIRTVDRSVLEPDKEGETLVWVSPLATHFSSTWWENPDSFDPIRFAGKFNKKAFYPFAHGTHRCFGEYLVLAQMKSFLIKCQSEISPKESHLAYRGLRSALALTPERISANIVAAHQ